MPTPTTNTFTTSWPSSGSGFISGPCTPLLSTSCLGSISIAPTSATVVSVFASKLMSAYVVQLVEMNRILSKGGLREDADISGNPCLIATCRGKLTQCTHSITANTTVVTREPYLFHVDAHRPQFH